MGSVCVCVREILAKRDTVWEGCQQEPAEKAVVFYSFFPANLQQTLATRHFILQPHK